MLNPELIVDTVVATLKTIPDLVTALTGDSSRIQALHYYAGVDLRVAEAIYKIEAPGILIAYERIIPGNFDGMTIFKHVISVYIRAANQANIQPSSRTGPGYIWYLICNRPVNGLAFPLHIRNIQILDGQLDLCDTPQFKVMPGIDLQDFGVGQFVFPEIGDQDGSL